MVELARCARSVAERFRAANSDEILCRAFNETTLSCQLEHEIFATLRHRRNIGSTA
jgi:hypothetical protein